MDEDGFVEADLDTSSPGTVSGFSSNDSSPIPPELHKSLYNVKLTDEVTKDGDVVLYTIKTTKVADAFKEFVVQRQYEDFEWLEHCLTTTRCIDGVIIPPLPSKPAITSQMAELKSRKQLGSSSKEVIGDEFHKDRLALERYLHLLANHRIFGVDPHLDDFLTMQKLSARTKLKKTIWNKITDKVENRKASHKDCEEFFQDERDWVCDYGAKLKDASESFNRMVYAQQRMCSALGHLSTAFSLCLGVNEGVNGTSNKLFSRFSEGLEDIKNCLEVEATNNEHSLGFCLDLYTRYLEAENDMLFRRTCLMVDYENANKSMVKSSYSKRDLAEETKRNAEQAFEECSDIAKNEIKQFHRSRFETMLQSIAEYAEHRVTTSRDTSTLLTTTLATIQGFKVPKCKPARE